MTDVFTWRVHANATGGGDFNVAKAKFGDGYQQSAVIGLNAEEQKWSVTTHATRDTMRDEIIAFIRAHKGLAFFWKPPLGVTGYYMCDGYKPNDLGGGIWTVSLEFYQVFFP